MKKMVTTLGLAGMLLFSATTGYAIDFQLPGDLTLNPGEDYQCPTYAEGQQQRSCILTGLDNCRMAHPDCDSQAFVLTTSDVTAQVQDLCCGAESVSARNKCFKKRRRELKRAKGLDPLYRNALKDIIKGYLTSDTVCGEE